jgi:hypothetical protein
MGVFKSKEEKKAIADERDAKYKAKRPELFDENSESYRNREAQKLLKEKGLDSIDKKITTYLQKDSKHLKDVREMNEKELQQVIALNLRTVVEKTTSIDNWMTFIGIVIILNIIGAIYIYSQM